MSTPSPDTDPGDSAPSPTKGRRIPRARWIVAVVIVALIAALLVWADKQAAKYYTFEPGTAPSLSTDAGTCKAGSGDSYSLPSGRPCALLKVPTGKGSVLDGSLLMVDVLVGKTTPVQFLLHEFHLLDTFEKGSTLYPNAAILGGTPASQLACQDAQEMVGAQVAAPVAALSYLGYKVTAIQHGALVNEVVPGTAASRAGIHCNDLVVGINGKTVKEPDDVDDILASLKPGDEITVMVKRTSGSTTKTVELKARLTGRPAIKSQGLTADPDHAFLGVAMESDTTYRLPFPVSFQVGDIGGPSAGLALTLGLLDTLTGGHLTGGKTVAATGTMAPNGDVGDVGGVAQKTIAVERAGAKLFLVPPQELKAAESEANGKMKIVAVTTLTQALAAIKAVGGNIPQPH